MAEFERAVAGYRARMKQEYYRTGMICTMIARLGGNKKSKPEDFVPKERKPEMTPEQMEEQAKVITAILGGEIKG